VNKPILHISSYCTNTFWVKIGSAIKNLLNFLEIYHKKLSGVRCRGAELMVQNRNSGAWCESEWCGTRLQMV